MECPRHLLGLIRRQMAFLLNHQSAVWTWWISKCHFLRVQPDLQHMERSICHLFKSRAKTTFKDSLRLQELVREKSRSRETQVPLQAQREDKWFREKLQALLPDLAQNVKTLSTRSLTPANTELTAQASTNIQILTVHLNNPGTLLSIRDSTGLLYWARSTNIPRTSWRGSWKIKLDL